MVAYIEIEKKMKKVLLYNNKHKDWKLGEQPEIPDFTFTENVGLTIDMPLEATPVYYTQLLLTNDLISENNIVIY